MKSPNELLSMVLANTTDDLFVLNPCEVVNVNGNYVDVKIYINDEYPNMILYNVPIQRQETQRAYIFLGIKEGDRGTLKFFDRSVEGYLQSDFDYNSDDRQHDINDRCFELGFIPDKEAYVYPNNVDIEIGLKGKSVKMSFTESGIAITGDVTITGNLTVSGTVKGTINATNGLTSGSNLDLVNVSNGIVTGEGSSS
jgi:hypothetical protein